MEENQFWLNFWRIAGITFAAIAVAIAGCETNRSFVVERMVKNGADPIAASCAINGIGTRELLCSQNSQK